MRTHRPHPRIRHRPPDPRSGRSAGRYTPRNVSPPAASSHPVRVRGCRGRRFPGGPQQPCSFVSSPISRGTSRPTSSSSPSPLTRRSRDRSMSSTGAPAVSCGPWPRSRNSRASGSHVARECRRAAGGPPADRRDRGSGDARSRGGRPGRGIGRAPARRTERAHRGDLAHAARGGRWPRRRRRSGGQPGGARRRRGVVRPQVDLSDRRRAGRRGSGAPLRGDWADIASPPDAR